MAHQNKNGGDGDKGARKDEAKKPPGSDNSPGRGGYSHADTRMGHEHSETLADLEHTITGSTPPRREDDPEGDADSMSRTSESREEKPRNK
jgi:hypothetical protein